MTAVCFMIAVCLMIVGVVSYWVLPCLVDIGIVVVVVRVLFVRNVIFVCCSVCTATMVSCWTRTHCDVVALSFFWCGGMVFLCTRAVYMHLFFVFTRILRNTHIRKQCNYSIRHKRTMGGKTAGEPSHNPSYTELLVNLLPSKRPRVVNSTEETTCTCTPSDACGFSCINRATYTECHPALCPAGSACTNQRLQRLHTTGGIACSLKHTPGKGFGVVADQVVRRGALVAEYCGEVVSRAEGERRAAAYAAQGSAHTYIMGLGYVLG